MFDKILIANRGEIACRVIKTARRMGIRTVAVYSDADRDALHVEMADEAVHIGPAAGRRNPISSSTRSSRPASRPAPQAVHPGYGFLSEREAFADGARGGRHRLHRPQSRRHRGDGRQDRIEEGGRGRRMSRPCRAISA